MKHKWIIISVFILIIVSIFIFYSKEDEGVPDSLIGRWTTSESRYKDRFFELSKATFTYGLGEDKEDVYFISSIEKNIQDNNTLYTINYRKDGLEYTRSFYYYMTNEGVIKFKNRKHIKWTREKDTSKEDVGFPDSLIGRWTTSESRYKDHFLELSNTTFTYGRGEKKDVHIISSIEKNIQDNKTLYTINYRNIDGFEYTRAFYYYPANGGVIKFKNLKDIKWTKEKDTYKEDEGLPDSLIGRWTTSESRYKDHFLELSKVKFTYGRGEDKIDVHIISSIEKNIQDNNTLYTINYGDINGFEYTRSFYYYPANGGVIKFKNQKDIKWTKEKDTVF